MRGACSIEGTPGDPPHMTERPEAPFDRYRGVVLPGWVDYNGHMNVAYYLVAFDLATDVPGGLRSRDRRFSRVDRPG
jgi:hypothetical protein